MRSVPIHAPPLELHILQRELGNKLLETLGRLSPDSSPQSPGDHQETGISIDNMGRSVWGSSGGQCLRSLLFPYK